MSNFYVGQRVVCVDDKSRTGRNVVAIKGNTYEIISISSCECGRTKLRLIGVFRESNPYSMCWCGSIHGEVHESTRFRPLLTDSIKFAEETLKEVTEHIKSRELILNN